MKRFHLGDILSLTTRRLVSMRHMEGVYDILNYMTRDNLFTHQLPRAYKECKPWLLRQHPWLKQIDASNVTPENHKDWLAKQCGAFGEHHNVERIPQDDHDRIDPYDELVIMRGTDEGIIIVEAEARE